MWIVGQQEEFYPSIYEFKTEEEARKYYSKRLENFKEEIAEGKIIVYLAEVKETTKHD